MNSYRDYCLVVDKYTDFLVQEFVSFLDAPLFEGKKFLDVFFEEDPDESVLLIFGINRIVFNRLVQAMISVKAIVRSNGKLSKGCLIFNDRIISQTVNEIFGKESSFEEDDLRFNGYLKSTLVTEQLNSVGTLKDYLTDSIAYDVLVVKRFLSPAATFNTLLSGSSAASLVFNLTSNQVFDHYKTNPRLLNVYGHGFVSSHFISDIDFINAIVFSENDKVVDVGGSFGNLGRIILEKNIDVEYYCLDLDDVTYAFNDELEQNFKQFGDKFKFIKTDFFAIGPLVSELEFNFFNKIFLGWILHDWNDAQCIEILKKCAFHMNEVSELFIFEILPNERKMSFDFTDWLMLAMADGYERSLFEYQKLFEIAGLELINTQSSDTGRSMMRLKVKSHDR